MITSDEIAFLKKNQLFKASGRGLLEFHRLLTIAIKPHQHNVSPVDIIKELAELNPRYLEQALHDMQIIFDGEQVSPTKLQAHIKPTDETNR